MLQNTSAKKRMLAEREQHLDVLLTVANAYKNTEDKETKSSYMNFIMWLGKITKRIKDELDQNDFTRYKYVEEMDRKIKEWNAVKDLSLQEEAEINAELKKLDNWRKMCANIKNSCN